MIVKSVVAVSISFALSFGIATGISVYKHTPESELVSQMEYHSNDSSSVPDEIPLNEDWPDESHMAGTTESADIQQKSIEPIAVRMGEILARMSPLDAASILASVDSGDLHLIVKQLPAEQAEAIRKQLNTIPRDRVIDSASLLGSRHP